MTEKRGHRRCGLTKLGSALALSAALLLTGCAEGDPSLSPTATESPTVLMVYVPAEPLDAAVTEAYIQQLETGPFSVQRVVAQNVDQPLFFNETEVKLTLQDLRQGATTMAVLRSGQVLNTLDPNTLLIPVTSPTQTPDPSATPHPWPSTATEKDTQLSQTLPITLRAAEPSQGQRGVRVLTGPAVKTSLELDSNDAVAEQCPTLTAFAQDGLPAAQVQAELAALYKCWPEEITAHGLAAVLRSAMVGDAQLALIDSANPAGYDKGLANAFTDESILRADKYRPLFSTSALSDEQIQRATDLIRPVSERLSSEELSNLFRYVNEEPTMTPAEAATWWLQRQGLLPEEN